MKLLMAGTFDYRYVMTRSLYQRVTTDGYKHIKGGYYDTYEEAHNKTDPYCAVPNKVTVLIAEDDEYVLVGETISTVTEANAKRATALAKLSIEDRKVLGL